MDLNKKKAQMPKRVTEKKCQYSGCNKMFYGITVAKFCGEHRSIKVRGQKYKKGDPNAINQTINHKNYMVKNEMVECALEGCNCKFELKIIPRTFIYPKYCELHRNEYKRILQLKSIGRDDLIDIMKKDSEMVRFSWNKRK